MVDNGGNDIELEVLEKLSCSNEYNHWSTRQPPPHYMQTKEEEKAAKRNLNRISCYIVVDGAPPVLYAGRSDGGLVLFRLTPRNQFGGAAKGERREEVISTSNPHRGGVQCLGHSNHSAKTSGAGSIGGDDDNVTRSLLASGGLDHTVKIWDIHSDTPGRESCLQTLTDSHGTVTAVAFARDGSILACSRDGKLRVYRAQKGRGLLLNPFFCCVRTLDLSTCVPAPPEGINKPSVPLLRPALATLWPTCMVMSGGEEWSSYVGTSEGGVIALNRTLPSISRQYMYNKDKEDKDIASGNNTNNNNAYTVGGSTVKGLVVKQIPANELRVSKIWQQLHRLGVTSLMVVPEHGLLGSLGADGCCRIMDLLRCTLIISINHPASTHQITYTGIAWDLQHEQLALCDSLGYIEVWNAYTERLLLRVPLTTELTLQSKKVKQRGVPEPTLSCMHSSNTDGVIYALSKDLGYVYQWRICESRRCTVIGNHRDAVTSILVLKDQPVTSTSTSSNGNKHIKRISNHSETLTDNPLLNDAILEPVDQYTSRGRRSRDSNTIQKSSTHNNSTSTAPASGDIGLSLVSTSLDGTLRAWELHGLGEKWTSHATVSSGKRRSYSSASDERSSSLELLCTCLLPGNESTPIMVAGTELGSVQFWQLSTGACTSFEAHKNSVSAVASCLHEVYGTVMLTTGSFDSDIGIWAIYTKDGKTQGRLPKLERMLRQTHGRPPTSTSTPANGTLPASYMPISTASEVIALCFVGRKGLFASGGNDGFIRCWDFTAGTLVAETHLTEQDADMDPHAVTCLVTHNFTLVAGHDNGFVSCWDMKEVCDVASGCGNGARPLPLYVFKPHNTTITAICVVPPAGEDVGRLITCCGDVEGSSMCKIWCGSMLGLAERCNDTDQHNAFATMSITNNSSMQEERRTPQLIREIQQTGAEFTCAAYVNTGEQETNTSTNQHAPNASVTVSNNMTSALEKGGSANLLLFLGCRNGDILEVSLSLNNDSILQTMSSISLCYA